MSTREFARTSRMINLINLNQSIILSVRETITAIEQLVFARNTHTHTSYFKSKNNLKSSILNYTHIYALKPSYS